MNVIRRFGLKLAIGFVFSLTLLAGTSYALEILLEPANVQRAVNGKVRVHIYATGAADLISMGVKVSFDPLILQVNQAYKNEDFDEGFMMDADGDSSTTDDQYVTPAVEIDNSVGTVVMIGGRLMGDDDPSGGDNPPYDSLSGKVLLGWIVFDAIATGNSALHVDLGRYHPNHPDDTFDNFVQLDGTVVEPTNAPIDLGSVCVLSSGACIADVNENGYTDSGDFAVLRSAMGKGFPDPAYNVKCDFNANGYVDSGDFSIMRSMMGQPCPSCP